MTNNKNFLADIEEAANGEPIEFVVIGEFSGYDGETRDVVPQDKRNVPVPWDEARAWFDYIYYDGLGGADCHAIYAYTATRLLAVHEYDGSTRVGSLPRNPTAEGPRML